MEKNQVKQRIIDDILVLLMFCISGNPAFVSTQPFGKIVYGLMLLIILIASRFKIKRETMRDCALWLFLLAIIFGFQFFLLGEITILGSLNFSVKLLSAILLASLLGTRLPSSAIRVMTAICIISLFFYLINLTGVRFESPLNIDMKSKSLIIYTQTWEEPFSDFLFRNSGMFWEPGAFAGYIIATLLLFIDQPQILFRRYKWSFIILSCTLLTTTSTTGYITYSILLLFFVFHLDKKGYSKWLKYVIAALFILGIIVAFTKIDFLGQKIQKEVLATERQTDADVNVSRTGSLLFDMQYIISHPIFGNGLSGSTRFRYHLGTYDERDLAGFGNGFSGCIASMGLLFMLAFLISIGLNRTLRARWMLILIIILLLQGEYFLNFPWFMMFPFIRYGDQQRSTPIRRKIRFVWNPLHEKRLQS